MKSHSSKLILPVTLGLCSLLSGEFAGAEELAYQWKPGQKFSYEVGVTIDSDSETSNYKGVIHYTVGNVSPGQATVTYKGGLKETKKYKAIRRGGFGPFGPGGFRPPSIPSPFSQPTFRGKTQTTNKITITPRGQTLAMEGDSQLPYLIGNVSLLPFEPLPDGDVTRWTDDGGVSITEKGNDDRHPFGRFGPMSPFARQGQNNVQAAGEESQYQIQSTKGDLVLVKKTYRLHTPPTKDNPSFDMSGMGTWTFDKKDNVPHACDMKLTLTVKLKNTSTSVPISVKYERLTPEKVAAMEAAAKTREEELARAAAEAKRMSETPLTPQEKQETLRALASGDNTLIRTTLDKLGRKSLKNPDPEVAAAIQPHLSSNDRFVSKSAASAMAKWSPDYAKQAKLNKEYQGPSPIKTTGRRVDSSTPLYVGQIVQAKRRNRGSFWYAARIKTVLPDNKVELGFLTWGEERGHSTEIVTRDNIQLPPQEYVQPVQPPAGMQSTAGMLSPFVVEGGSRKWTDATGRFTVEGTFEGVADGTVTLKRADGKTMRIPLAKLSRQDQAHVKQLQDEQSKQAENPFELVD